MSDNLPIRATSSEVDHFDFEDPHYDINEFYVTSTDGHGRSDFTRVRIDPAIHAQLTHWLQINKFPACRVIGDFLRDALRHRLEYLNHSHPRAAHDDDMWKALDIYTRKAVLDKRKDRSRANEGYVSEFSDRCAEFLTREDWGELDGTLNDATDMLEYLPQPFKGRMSALIDHYRPYLTGRTW